MVGSDLILLGGSRILTNEIIKLSKYGIINLHSGILPDVKGANAMIWSIYNDVPLVKINFLYIYILYIDNMVLVIEKITILLF